MGPVGSSKSSACCIELFTRACEQKPWNGVRKTRWAVVRATYRELESTTLKTWAEWFPFAKTTFGSPIVSSIKLPLGDGTVVDMETMFFPLEDHKDIENLGSLEITGFWMNEARELAVDVLNKLTERVGRFPKLVRGPKGELLHGPTWRGGVMDTNPPDDDGWWYALSEKTDSEIRDLMEQTERKLRELGQLGADQAHYEFFKQPGGLILRDGQYESNPLAENILHLDGGYGYYYRQLAGKRKPWIKAQILGQYATTSPGKPVYEEYNDDLHCRELHPIKGLPIIVGQDWGRTPAAVLCQQKKNGQFRIIDEVVADSAGARTFARDYLKPHLAQTYPDYQIIVIGDPSGNDPRDTEEKTCFQIFAEEGLSAVPALTNEQLARIEALSDPMNKMIDGEPGFLISPKAVVTRKGLNGGYHYKRVNIGGDRYTDKPDKNKYSHPVEGAQYAGLHCKYHKIDDSWGKPIKYPKNGGIV
jgi:hypothetical protein